MNPHIDEQCWARWLDLCVRAAARAAGRVEPNPLVGCAVIPKGVDPRVRTREQATELVRTRRVALGHHRAFGGPHAEVEALAAAERLGLDARGATAVVTLEPCNHRGKTGPCSEALVRAGVGRVVYAVEDPNEEAQGGAARLRDAGIEAVAAPGHPGAERLVAPFAHRVRTGLPWVIGKWAQTIDGRVATRTGDGRWITSARTRRRVHQLRGRVDAILTGVGTVLRDDPSLTVRGVVARRTPQRVVVDPLLETPETAQVLAGVDETPTVVIGSDRAPKSRRAKLESRGCVVHMLASDGGVFDWRALLSWLAAERGVATMLTEAGPRVLGGLAREDLLGELRVFVGGKLLGDEAAPGPLAGGGAELMRDATAWALAGVHRMGDDVELRYMKPTRG